jgi:hypothetical protein
MNLKRIAKAALALSLLSAWTAWQHDLVGQAQKVQVPIFEYDPTFPKPLPENWAIGPIGGFGRRSAGSPLRPAATRWFADE